MASAALLDSFLARRPAGGAYLEDADGVEEIEKAAFLLPRVADPAAYAYHRFNVYKGDGDHEHKMHFA
jgi:hypothetical protein